MNKKIIKMLLEKQYTIFEIAAILREPFETDGMYFVWIDDVMHEVEKPKSLSAVLAQIEEVSQAA